MSIHASWMVLATLLFTLGSSQAKTYCIAGDIDRVPIIELDSIKVTVQTPGYIFQCSGAKIQGVIRQGNYKTDLSLQSSFTGGRVEGTDSRPGHERDAYYGCTIMGSAQNPQTQTYIHYALSIVPRETLSDALLISWNDPFGNRGIPNHEPARILIELTPDLLCPSKT